jgi:phage/plasmid-associated DNA primase
VSGLDTLPSPIDLTGPQQAANFIRDMFDNTEAPIFLCSFGNERDGKHYPQSIAVRKPDDIERFLTRWDQPERGLFFCVGTVNGERNKPNIVETIGLHADIDFKDVDESVEDIERKLGNLRFAPSIMVRSGNGVHAYWLFKEAIKGEMDRVESALRQLADLIAGDLQVCEIARVMRLPGSHNTKRGAWIPVTISHQSERRYELNDLEEWLAETSPVILRKVRERALTAGEASDPYADYGALAYKPPIDVKARLDGMMFMGGGDAAIHSTQLAVTASMLNAGHAVADIVTLVLDATKAAAGDYGKRWNWRKEEKTIEDMCTGWVKKHGVKTMPGSKQGIAENRDSHLRNESVGGGATVHALKPKKGPKISPKPNELHHVKLGLAVVGLIQDRGDDLMFTPKGGSWRYSNGLWSMATDGMNAWLNVEIEKAAQALDYSSTSKNINETREWIKRQPELWCDDVKWDAHGLIPTRSGLVDPMTGDVTPTRPDHYVTWRIEADYDPTAACPWWLQMLEDCFEDRSSEDRAATILVIQELLGAGLVDEKPRALSRALIFQGGSNFGKSGLLEVLAGLFGPEVNSTSIEALEGTHGMMAFLNRRPWVLHEAFDQRKWHFSNNVKTIITGEPIPLNIKNGPLRSIRIRSPIFWGTNHPPQFKEATKAIVNRLVVIECRREFLEDAPVGAAVEAFKRKMDKPSSLVLADELAGVLAWAVVGLRRALERGYLSLTTEMIETTHAIRRDSNLVAGFLEECITYDYDQMISTPDFCLAFAAWWQANRGETLSPPSNQAIGKALETMADPLIALDRTLRDPQRRYYAGIILNEEGLAFHRAGAESHHLQAKTANATDPHDKVNRLIQAAWMEKPSVIAMRERAILPPAGSKPSELTTYLDTGQTPAAWA